MWENPLRRDQIPARPEMVAMAFPTGGGVFLACEESDRPAGLSIFSESPRTFGPKNRHTERASPELDGRSVRGGTCNPPSLAGDPAPGYALSWVEIWFFGRSPPSFGIKSLAVSFLFVLSGCA